MMSVSAAFIPAQSLEGTMLPECNNLEGSSLMYHECRHDQSHDEVKGVCIVGPKSLLDWWGGPSEARLRTSICVFLCLFVYGLGHRDVRTDVIWAGLLDEASHAFLLQVQGSFVTP